MRLFPNANQTAPQRGRSDSACRDAFGFRRPLPGIRFSLTGLPFLLMSLLLALLLSAPLYAADDPQVTETRIRKLQGAIRQLESRLSRAETERQREQQKLRAVEKASGALSRSISAKQKALQRAGETLKRLETQRQGLIRRRQAQTDALASQLAQAFRIGRQDRLRLYLSQEDPQRITRLLRYYDYLGEARVQAIARYQETLAELQAVEDARHREQRLLREQTQQLAEKEAQLKQQRTTRAHVVASLKKEIRGNDARLQQLKADQQRLEGVLKELQQALVLNELSLDAKSFRQLKGRLPWPTTGNTQLSFGQRTDSGVKMEGMLFAGRTGQPVRAIHSGRVVFSEWLRGYGLLLIVDHGGGYMSLYGHNQSLIKEVGDWVTSGEPLATVGDSGGRGSPGLYFAIRHKGQPINPKAWLNASQR